MATASTPKVVARALPVSDISLLGCRSVAMFDYDPALATSLGDELDPSMLLD